jgi:hypothetical protein
MIEATQTELAREYLAKYVEIFGSEPLRLGSRDGMIVNLLDLNSIRTFRENCHAVERDQLFEDTSP